MMALRAPTTRPIRWRTWPDMLAYGALVTLSLRRTTLRRGRVTASLAALLAPCPLLLWGLWGLSF